MNKIKSFSWKVRLFIVSIIVFVAAVILQAFYLSYYFDIFAFVALYFLAYYSFLCTNARCYLTGNLKELDGKKEIRRTGMLYLICLLLYDAVLSIVINSHFLSNFNIIERGYEWAANLTIVIVLISIAVVMTKKK